MPTNLEFYQEVLRTAARAGMRDINKTSALSTLLILAMRLRPRKGSQPLWEELETHYDVGREQYRKTHQAR
jgi:hypothetical protein